LGKAQNHKTVNRIHNEPELLACVGWGDKLNVKIASKKYEFSCAKKIHARQKGEISFSLRIGHSILKCFLEEAKRNFGGGKSVDK